MGANHDDECPCSTPSRSGDQEEPEEGVIPEATAGGELLLLGALQASVQGYFGFGGSTTVSENPIDNTVKRFETIVGNFTASPSIDNLRELSVNTSNVVAHVETNATASVPLVDGIYSILATLSEVNATELFDTCTCAWEVNATAKVFEESAALAKSLENGTIAGKDVSSSISNKSQFNETLTNGLLSNGRQVEPHLTQVGLTMLGKLDQHFPVNEDGTRTSILDKTGASHLFESVVLALAAYGNVTHLVDDAVGILGNATSESGVSLNDAKAQIESLLETGVESPSRVTSLFEPTINPGIATVKPSGTLTPEEMENSIQVEDSGNPYDRNFEIVFREEGSTHFRTPKDFFDHFYFNYGKQSEVELYKSFAAKARDLIFLEKGSQMIPGMSEMTKWTSDVVKTMIEVFNLAMDQALREIGKDFRDPETLNRSRALVGMTVGMRNALGNITSADFTGGLSFSVKQSVYFLSQYFTFGTSRAGLNVLSFVANSSEVSAEYSYALAEGDASVYKEGLPISEGEIPLDPYRTDEYAEMAPRDMRHFAERDFAPQFAKDRDSILSSQDCRSDEFTDVIDAANRYTTLVNLNKYAQPILDGRPPISRDDAGRVKDLLDDLLRRYRTLGTDSNMRRGYYRAMLSFSYQTMAHFMMYGDIRTPECSTAFEEAVGNLKTDSTSQQLTKIDTINKYSTFLDKYRSGGGFQSLSRNAPRDERIGKLIAGHSPSGGWFSENGWRPASTLMTQGLPISIRDSLSYHMSLWGRSIAKLAFRVDYRVEKQTYNSKFHDGILNAYRDTFSREVCDKPAHGYTTFGLPDPENDSGRWNANFSSFAGITGYTRDFKPVKGNENLEVDPNTALGSSEPWSPYDIANAMAAVGTVGAAAGLAAIRRPRPTTSGVDKSVRPVPTGGIEDYLPDYLFDENGEYTKAFYVGVATVMTGIANSIGATATLERATIGIGSQILKPLVLTAAVDSFAISVINGNPMIYKETLKDAVLQVWNDVFGPLVSVGAVVGPTHEHVVILISSATILYKVITLTAPSTEHIDSFDNFVKYGGFGACAKLITPFLWFTGTSMLGYPTETNDANDMMRAWFMWVSVWVGSTAVRAALAANNQLRAGTVAEIKNGDRTIAFGVEHSLGWWNSFRKTYYQYPDIGRLFIFESGVIPLAAGMTSFFKLWNFSFLGEEMEKLGYPGYAVGLAAMYISIFVSDMVSRKSDERTAKTALELAVSRSLRSYSEPPGRQGSGGRVPRSRSVDFTDSIVFNLLSGQEGYITPRGIDILHSVFSSQKIEFYYDDGQGLGGNRGAFNAHRRFPKGDEVLYIYYKFERDGRPPIVDYFFDGSTKRLPSELRPWMDLLFAQGGNIVSAASRFAGRSAQRPFNFAKGTAEFLKTTVRATGEARTTSTRITGGPNPASVDTVTTRDTGFDTTPLEMLFGFGGLTGAVAYPQIAGKALEGLVTGGLNWYQDTQIRNEALKSAEVLFFECFVPLFVNCIVVLLQHMNETKSLRAKPSGQLSVTNFSPIRPPGGTDRADAGPGRPRGALIPIDATAREEIFPNQRLNLALAENYINRYDFGKRIIPDAQAKGENQFHRDDIRVFLDPDVAQRYGTQPGQEEHFVPVPDQTFSWPEGRGLGQLQPGLLILCNSSVTSIEDALKRAVNAIP